MTDLSFTEMAERLEAAERELAFLRSQLSDLHLASRRTRIRAVAVFSLVIGLVLVAWAGSGVLRAADQSAGTNFQAPFTILGKNGQPILVVSDGPKGPFVSLRNGEGKVAVNLASNSDGSGLVAAFDGKGRVGEGAPAMAAMGFQEGQPFVLAQGAIGSYVWMRHDAFELFHNQLPAARIKYYDDTAGYFSAYDLSGKPVAVMTSSEGRGAVAIANPKSKNTAAVLGVFPDGYGGLDIYDPDHKDRLRAGGPAGFSAFNPSGQSVAEFGANQSGSSGRLWLGNAAGEGIVEGGMLTDGRGTIRTGPSIGGPPPGLVMPDRLVGHLH